MRAKKRAAGAFGDWPVRARKILASVLGDLFSPPVSPGDEVAIKTLLGDAVTGEVLEAFPAGITVKEDNGEEYETFVASGSIDSMKVYRLADNDAPEDEAEDSDDDDTEEDEPIGIEGDEPEPAPEKGPENA